MKYNVRFATERRKDKEGNLIVTNIPIFADIRFAGTRMFYFTGFRIDADKFDSENQQAKKESTGKEGSRIVKYDVINRRIKKMKAELEILFQDNKTVTKEKVKILLDNVCMKAVAPVQEVDEVEFFSMFEKYHDISKLSNYRKKKMKVLMNHLRRYEVTRGLKITFESITVDLLRDFENYLRKESGSPRGKSKTAVYKPLSENSVHSLLSLFHTFWNFARTELKREGIELKQPFGKEGYQVSGEKYGEPIYITKEERNFLFKANIESERLQRVRDIFVFQCLIGARVGDLCKMTKSNIQFNEEIKNEVISYIPRKTKDGKPVTVTVPLNEQAKEILSRYNIPDGRLLPFITDQRYNDYLKELFRLVGINRIVARLNPNTGEPEQVSICDIVSSHMARRAFVGNLYGKVSSSVISEMSGHVKGSKAFTRYYKVSDELKQQAINQL